MMTPVLMGPIYIDVASYMPTRLRPVDNYTECNIDSFEIDASRSKTFFWNVAVGSDEQDVFMRTRGPLHPESSGPEDDAECYRA